MLWILIIKLLVVAVFKGVACAPEEQQPLGVFDEASATSKNAFMQREAFLDSLIANMSVPELVLQLHLMSADNIVSKHSDNSLFEQALRHSPGASIGVLHDLYATNKSQYNSLQKLNLERSNSKIPFLQYGECLHGVGSFKQSMFPQSIGLAASFDTDLVHRVGSAIGAEARSIGIHACLSPVLDLGLEPRWGRVQEAWGEDMLLASLMGVAMTSGLSKNGSWDRPDAVAPIVKHLAAHGSAQGGINGAPSYVLGTRQVMQQMLRPFKAVIDLGGAKGVMMCYSELDGIPSHVHPMLYKVLDDWGFDGIVTADDHGIVMLEERHRTAASPADAIMQWFNAGGMVQYYDYPLEVYLNTTIKLVANGSVALPTLQSHVRRILALKHDLGLFNDPYISETINSQALTEKHVPLTLEAAQKSIVLLENRNQTLPIKPREQNISKIALIGPFVDTLNYGGYSGQYGALPVASSSTIRQAMLAHLANHAPNTSLVTSWGVNDWYFNAQRNIPGYLLSTPNGTTSGLLATYYADTDFVEPVFQAIEAPNRDWGLFPPNGLPSNNFSAIWEGSLTVPVDGDVDGWLGVAVSANASARLYVYGVLVQDTEMSRDGTFMSNIPGYKFTSENEYASPPGGREFRFVKGSVLGVRLEFQAWNMFVKDEASKDMQTISSKVHLFWNLVDRYNPIEKAVSIASTADTIVLALGASWSSDGEGGDRSTLTLSAPQTALFHALLTLNIPITLILQGGRPFAIPDLYARSSAVLNTFFPGQSGGQAISDILFGVVNPGGRVPVSVPRSVGVLPAFYHFKTTARKNFYLDTEGGKEVLYPFGYGLSYTSFEAKGFKATSTSHLQPDANTNPTFMHNDTIKFTLTLHNTGTVAGSYVPQVYLLARISPTTQPEKQLVAFKRVYLEPGEERVVHLELDVDRYLPVLGREAMREGEWNWVLERGEYVFLLAGDSGVVGGGDFEAEVGTGMEEGVYEMGRGVGSTVLMEEGMRAGGRIGEGERGSVMGRVVMVCV